MDRLAARGVGLVELALNCRTGGTLGGTCAVAQQECRAIARLSADDSEDSLRQPVVAPPHEGLFFILVPGRATPAPHADANGLDKEGLLCTLAAHSIGSARCVCLVRSTSLTELPHQIGRKPS